MKSITYKTFIIAVLCMVLGCEKFVTVDEVKDSLLAEQVFENETTANAAILGIYKAIRVSIPTYLTSRAALSSDELVSYSAPLTDAYYTNNIQPATTAVPWGPLYSCVYASNNAIEKLTESKRLTAISKSRLIAEAKFLRAFCYFYLVNLFGEVPLVLTTNIHENSLIKVSNTTTIYDQIVADLTEAKATLVDDYSHAGNQRIRANKWAAGALLARVYLYQQKYSLAESESLTIINSGKYSLVNSTIGIFSKNNTESILQLANNTIENISVARDFIYTSTPLYVLSAGLLSSFEANDLRKTNWIRTQTLNSQPVSIPFKLTSTQNNPPEYYTLLRLAEVYLIHAEALAMRDDFAGAVAGVNLIRSVHGGLTTPLTAATSRQGAIDQILHERQVDLFTEGAHRWLDLKRTNRLNATMSAAKPTTWKSSAAIYPIPLSEIQRNPNLQPTPGYIY